MNGQTRGGKWLSMFRLSLTLLVMLVRSVPVIGSVTVLNMVLLGILPSAGVWVLERTTGVAENVVLGASPLKALVAWIVLLAAVQGLESLLLQLHIWINSFSQEEFRRQLQKRLMEKSQALRLERFEDPQFFDLLVSARRSINSGDFIMMMIRLAESWKGVLILMSLAGILISYDIRLLLAVVVAGLPIMFNRLRHGRRRYSLYKEQIQNTRLSEYLSRLQTDRAAAKEIRLFQIGEYLRERWYQLARPLANCRVALADRQGRSRAVIDSGSHVGFVGALSFGIWLTVNGALEVSAFVALFETLRRFQTALTELLTQSGQQYERVLRFADLLQFLDLPYEEEKGGIAKTAGRTRGIVVKDVGFTYPGQSNPALDGVSFCIGPGETIALVGPNGAGKSTMVRLMLGLYQPTGGEIKIDGVPLNLMDPRSMRADTSSVFQDFMRYHLSVRHNIGFGNLKLLDEDQSLKEAARRGGAGELLTRLGDFDAMLGREFAEGTDLSGGEWQRVAIARSYMREASVVVLDEPTASLDPLAEADVFKRFARLAVGSVALLVSHRLGSARLADRIVVLDEGRLVEQGTHAELLALDGMYARMWREQANWYSRDWVRGRSLQND